MSSHLDFTFALYHLSSLFSVSKRFICNLIPLISLSFLYSVQDTNLKPSDANSKQETMGTDFSQELEVEKLHCNFTSSTLRANKLSSLIYPRLRPHILEEKHELSLIRNATFVLTDISMPCAKHITFVPQIVF